MKISAKIFVIPMLIMLTGCDVVKNLALGRSPFAKKPAPVPVEKPLITYMDSADLAKIILKPERKPLTISRDPFKPLIDKPVEFNPNDPNSPTTIEDNLEDVHWVGVVKLGDELRVYLKTQEKTGVFKVGDTIRSYTITHIDIHEVIFKSEKNEVVKKREVLKK